MKRETALFISNVLPYKKKEKKLYGNDLKIYSKA